MRKIVGIFSGKGGTGKTTICINLATALNNYNINPIIIDANFQQPNVSFFLGMDKMPFYLQEALEGKIDIQRILYSHPSGISIVPSSVSNDYIHFEPSNLQNEIEKLEGVILVDAPSGHGKINDEVLKSCDGIIIVTNPDELSLYDAKRVCERAKEQEKKVFGIIVNKSKIINSLSNEEIQKIVGARIIYNIPFDNEIQKAYKFKTPVLKMNEKAKSSKAFNNLARLMLGKEVVEDENLIEKMYKKLYTLFRGS